MHTLVRAVVLAVGSTPVLSPGGCARDSTDPGTEVEDGHLPGPGRW